MKYLIFTVVFTALIHGQVIITEVMFNPAGGDSPNEFVELYNSADTIMNLTGWQIHDLKATDGLLSPTQDTAIVMTAKSYAVIHEGDYDGTMYAGLIPDTAAVFFTTTTTIGNNLGNTADSLILTDASGLLIDQMGWDQALPAGYSLEKVRLDQPNSPANWQVCHDSLGTPGRRNSVAPHLIDGRIILESISHSPLYPESYESFIFTCQICNVGLEEFMADLLIADSFGSVLGSHTITILKPADTVSCEMQLAPLPSGTNIVELFLSIIGDQATADNSAFDTVAVSHRFGVVQINEFLSQPADGYTEFIEIINLEPVNLLNWSIADNNLVPRLLPAIGQTANTFTILAPDSGWWTGIPAAATLIVPAGWPTLNNGADGIFLFDNTGKIIDSLRYDESWPVQPGRSLEKLRPDYPSASRDSWSAAVNQRGFTPGETNSIHVESVSDGAKITCSPNPFSPDDDGFEDLLQIHFQLPYDLATIDIEIFDVVGRLISAPAWNQAAAREGIISWDGMDENKRPARTGIYIIKFTARDRQGGASWEDVQTVVVVQK